jgi:hypothetical protein
MLFKNSTVRSSKESQLFISRFLLLVSIIFLSVFSAFRGDTADTAGYIDIYYASLKYDLDHISERYNIEPLYYFLSNFTSILLVDHRFFFFIYSIIIFAFILAASKQVGAPYGFVIIFYVLTYFVSYQFTLMRQGLALAFVYYIISLIYNTNAIIRILFLLLLGILGCFATHIVSLMPLVMLTLIRVLLLRYDVKAAKKYIIYSLFLSFGCFVVFFMMSQYFGVIFDLLNNEKLNYYSESEEYSAAGKIFALPNLRSILGVVLAIYIFRNKYTPSTVGLLFISIYSIQVAIRFGFIDFAILTGRLGSVFAFFDAFLYSIFLANVKINLLLKIPLLMIVFLIGLIFVFGIQYPDFLEDYFRATGY